jgi:hypothetical protein
LTIDYSTEKVTAGLGSRVPINDRKVEKHYEYSTGSLPLTVLATLLRVQPYPVGFELKGYIEGKITL